MSRRMLVILAVAISIVGPDVLAVYQAPAAEGLRVIIIDGDEAANIVADRIAAEPVIEVRDRDDRQVPGAVVRFLIRRTVRDRVSAVFRSGQSEVRTLTDAVGRARASGLTPLQPGSFEIEIQVSHQGQTATATIRHTNYATVAAALAAGHEPSQPSGSNAVTQGAVAGGGGMSGLAIAALVIGGAASAGGGYYYYEQSRKGSTSPDGGVVEPPPPPATPPAPATPPGRVTAVTASVTGGLQTATEFTFSAEAVDFEAGSLSYHWEFGDGAASSDPTPTHVYQSAGTYTVAVTVSDARQSARSEMSVTVRAVTGTWREREGDGGALQLTQSGSTISGSTIYENLPIGRFECPITGSAQRGTPSVVLFQPRCVPPGTTVPLLAGEFRFDLSADGQTLTGIYIHETGQTGHVVLRRQ